MKKIALFIALIFSLGIFAQNKPGNFRNHLKNNFTPEQQATIKTKKMALQLDLSAAQQNKVYNLILDQEQNLKKLKLQRYKDRLDGKMPSSDDRFKMISNNLDNRLAFQNALKNVLNDKQYAQWKQFAEKRFAMVHKMMKRPDGHRSKGFNKNKQHPNYRDGRF